jgi:hypothetical protein
MRVNYVTHATHTTAMTAKCWVSKIGMVSRRTHVLAGVSVGIVAYSDFVNFILYTIDLHCNPETTLRVILLRMDRAIGANLY